MRNREKVLVVDKNEVHLDRARNLLESDEIEVVTHTGAFGVTSRVRVMQPDLILLGINVPPLSDDNLASLLHNCCDSNRIPVIFQSSDDEGSMVESVKIHSVQGYICKGDPADLRIKVKMVLNKQSKVYI